MEFIFSAAATRTIENETMSNNELPSILLMEQAGTQIAAKIAEDIGNDVKKIVVVCGKGNNGGDGCVIARYLYQNTNNCDVSILLAIHNTEFGEALDINDDISILEKYLSKENYCNLIIASNMGIPIVIAKEGEEYLNDADVIVDALFGIGITRDITGIEANIIDKINASNATVYSVDTPSGTHSDSARVLGNAVKADVTYALGVKKYCHMVYPAKAYCGNVELLHLSLDKNIKKEIINNENVACVYSSSELKELIPARNQTSNKSTYGRVLIIAGSEGMPGAALLASETAYRMGCGYVTLSAPKSVTDLAAVKLPELLINNDYKKLDLTKYDVLLIGPGIGTNYDARDRLNYIISNKPNTLMTVVDADALNIISDQLDEGINIYERLICINSLLGDNYVLTPHKKELSRLLGIDVKEINYFDIADKARKILKGTLVMKDASTLIVSRDGFSVNQSGNNGLSVAGSGDVLAGVITGLLGCNKGQNGYDMARLGVYLHGLVADKLALIKSTASIIPSDLVEYLKNNDIVDLF